MNLTYQTEEMREACHDLQVATRQYGKQIAKKLHKKIALLNAASNLAQLMSFDNNAHWLEGNRHWQFSIPLAQGHSLLLTPPDRATRAPQELEAMEVIKVEDYHR
jgi:toxin HigB-1